MADRHGRSLERRWKSDGDPTAGATWIRSRLRHGSLCSDRIRLAALLGDRSSRIALALPQDPPATRLEQWVFALAGWGREPLVRTLIVAAGWHRARWERWLGADRRPHVAIDAALAWLGQPCPEHARLALAASHHAEASLRDLDEQIAELHTGALDRLDLRRLLAPVARSAARAAALAGAPSSDAVSETVRALSECLRAKGRVFPSIELQLRQALARELIPWALEPTPTA